MVFIHFADSVRTALHHVIHVFRNDRPWSMLRAAQFTLCLLACLLFPFTSACLDATQKKGEIGP